MFTVMPELAAHPNLTNTPGIQKMPCMKCERPLDEHVEKFSVASPDLLVKIFVCPQDR